MRVGLTLAGDLLNDDGARFAAQLGVDRRRRPPHRLRRAAPTSAPIWPASASARSTATARRNRLWTYDDFSGIVAHARAPRPASSRRSRISRRTSGPTSCSTARDKRRADGGPEAPRPRRRPRRRSGHRLQFLDRRRLGLAAASRWRAAAPSRPSSTSAAIDPDEPIPDGMVWNMRYRDGSAPARAPVSVSDAELWERLAVVPQGARAGRRGGRRQARRASRRSAGRSGCAAPRGSSTTRRSTTACSRIVDSPANALEFCIGSLPEMPSGDIYADDAPLRARRRRSPMSISATCAARCRATTRPSSTTATSTWPRSSASCATRAIDGVLVPDHVPELACPAPWHAGHAYTVGYMQALVAERRRARAVADARPRHRRASTPRPVRQRSNAPAAGAAAAIVAIATREENMNVKATGRPLGRRRSPRWRSPAAARGRRDRLVDAELGRGARRGARRRSSRRPIPASRSSSRSPSPTACRTRIQTALHSGSPPDLIEVQHGWVSALRPGRPGAAARRRARGPDDYVPAALDYDTWDGKLWGIPYRIETHGVIYNKGDVQGRRARPGEAAADLDRAGRRGEEADRQDADGRTSTASPSPAAARSATPSSARCPSSG